MSMRRGLAVSPGIARGPASVIPRGAEFLVPTRRVDAAGVEAELAKLQAALQQAEAQLLSLQATVRERIGPRQADIFNAQALLLKDPGFLRQISDKVESQGVNVEAALWQVVEEVSLSFQKIEDPYFRERAADIRDVGRRLLSVMTDGGGASGWSLPEGAVVVAEELSPSLTAHLQSGRAAGFVTEKGGRASHAAILARSAGLPAVAGVPDVLSAVKDGDYVIVDGLAGTVHINPKRSVVQEYERLEADFRAYKSALRQLVDLPSVTADGVPVAVRANIGKMADAEAALLFKSQGVGLYRLEFAFSLQSYFPTEQEQYDLLRRVAERFKPEKVVFRLLDIGADKALSYFPLPASRNPALARRGIRLLLKNPLVLKSQLRALLRAGADLPVEIMLPMVGGLEEVHEFKKVLESVKGSLRSEGLPFSDRVPLGAMIEVPSAALTAERLVSELDFFSVGTNDLVQYLLAADREDQDMSVYYEPLHPAVLSVLKSLADVCRRQGKGLALCGEMGGDPYYTELLLGLGLREFSVAPGEILEVKKAVRSARIAEAEELAGRALKLGSVREIDALLRSRLSRPSVQAA